MIVVFFVSGESQVAVPDVGLSLDKFAHFAVFGVLATSLVRLPFFTSRGWKGAFEAAAIAVLYGGFDEVRQSFTPGRAVELADWVADTLGAVAAVILYRGFRPFRDLLEWSVQEFRLKSDRGSDKGE